MLEALIIVLALCLLGCSFRLFVGPSLADRLLALDLMVIIAIGIFCLLFLRNNEAFFMELAMVTALAGFVSTLAFCRAIVGKRK